MTPSIRISLLRPAVAAVTLLTLCAGAMAQTYAPPPAPVAPAYDGGDPASANLALVDRSPEPPPPLPVYVQPPAPADGYMWVPGYWSRNQYGFFWVPGAWVLAPYAGALWTPGYWGFTNGLYVWNAGYWGPHVGFYGGINYGFGYVGLGYVGGYWKRDRFYYNRSVTNVNVTRVTNVYNHTVVVNNIDNRRVSFHGGPNGIRRAADPRELAARKDRHAPPTDMQRRYVRDAGSNRAQFYDHNKGRPPQAFVDHRDNGRPSQGPRPGGDHKRPDADRGNNPGRGEQARGPGPSPGRDVSQRDQQAASQQSRQQQARDQQARQQQQQDRQQQVRQQQEREQRQQQGREQQQQQARQQQAREHQAREQQARQQQARQQQAREQPRQQAQARPQQDRPQQQARPQQAREHPQQRQQGGGEGRGDGRGGGPNRD